MHPLTSDLPLIVYIDVKSPYAFVAIAPTLALESELDMQFDWRPITLDIPSFLGSARKSKGKVVESNRSPRQWMGVKYSYKDARRYAERQGHILKGTEKIWDSSLANMGILWVMQRQRDALAAYLNAVYPAFWRRELDIEDPEVVTECLRQAGAPTEGFSTFLVDQGRAAHDELQARLHPAGVFGVPTYVVDDEILFGREHLPYVAWCLRGHKGAAPDIAYGL